MAGIATSGITYYELYGSGGGEIAFDGTITRYYQVAWTSRVAFINALIGGFARVGDTNYYYTYPDRDPDWTALYCQSTDLEGLGAHSTGASNQIAYEWAKITAKYSALKFDINAAINNIFEEELEWSAQVLSLPGDSLETTTGKISDAAQVIIPTTDYTLTIEGSPFLPGGGDGTTIQTIQANPLNASTFLGASAKKVMFKGARASRTTTTAGAKNWKIVLRFTYRPIEWDKVYNKTAGAWETATHVGSSAPLYGTSDLSLLLPR